MTVLVRRIAPDDADRLRRVRLAALADAPESFWQTFAAESARPFADWEARATRNSSGDAHATFLVEWPGRTAGMVDVYQPSQAPDFRELAAMWVAPEARGTGAAGALIDAAVDWARSVGATGVRLWVRPTNTAALRLYARYGFAQIGEPTPDEGDGRVYLPMALTLAGEDATSPAFLARALAPWTDESG